MDSTTKASMSSANQATQITKALPMRLFNSIQSLHQLVRHATATSACLAACVLVGCKNVNTVNSTDNGGFQQIVTNGWLQYKANVVAVHEGLVNGDMKKVAVDIYSDQSTQQNFSYRFEWFDGNGMPIRSATQITTGISIHPKETITVTSVAPSANAARWTLKLYDTQHPL